MLYMLYGELPLDADMWKLLCITVYEVLVCLQSCALHHFVFWFRFCFSVLCLTIIIDFLVHHFLSS